MAMRLVAVIIKTEAYAFVKTVVLASASVIKSAIVLRQEYATLTRNSALLNVTIVQSVTTDISVILGTAFKMKLPTFRR